MVLEIARRSAAATAGSSRRATTSTSASAATRSEGPRLRAELRRLCEAYGIDPDAATDTRGYRLPMRRPGTTLARGTTAVIGDAAGLVDPFSGDGMYEAFLSAKLVAEAALDVLAGRAETLEPYARGGRARGSRRSRAPAGARSVAFERFPRTTFALARLPITFRALEKLLARRSARAGGRPRRREGRDPRDLRASRGSPPKAIRPVRADPSSAMDLNGLLRRAVELGASDIHLKIGQPPVAAAATATSSPIEDWPSRSTTRTLEAVAHDRRSPIAGEARAFHATGDLDLAYQDAGLPRFRVNAFRQRGATSFAFRVIPSTSRRFDQLSLPPGVERLADEHRGLCSSPARPARARRRRSPRWSTTSTARGSSTS